MKNNKDIIYLIENGLHIKTLSKMNESQIKVLVEKTLALGFKIEYRWLKGHKGGESQHAFPWMFNHQVDALATAALA